MALVPQLAHGKVDAALSSRMTGSPRKTGEMQSRLTGAKRPFDAVAEDRCFVAYARGDVLPCPYQVAIKPDAISPPRPGRCLLDKTTRAFFSHSEHRRDPAGPCFVPCISAGVCACDSASLT